MLVRIFHNECEYEPDYPDGWVFSKGDYFKRVIINETPCFAKRFEIQNPENISGWHLLQKLKGQTAESLATVHDVVLTVENNAKVYYVFFEFLEGKTLYHAIHYHERINLEALTDNLFKAVHSLQKNNYWFADFTEKNIYCTNDEQFLFIDLDSAQPIQELPNNNMWGDKEYWALVFDFYKKNLGKTSLKPSDINGTVLNYLQVVFLVFRLKLFSKNEQHEHLYNDLPLLLNQASPSLKNIFLQLLQNNGLANDEYFIDALKTLVFETILNPEKRKESVFTNNVEIQKFKIENAEAGDDNESYVIEKNKEFTINWLAVNAEYLELYRNEKLLKKFESNKGNTNFKEAFNEEKKIVYTLIAYNNSGHSEPKSIIINQQLIPVIDDFILTNYLEKYNTHYTINKDETLTFQWKVQNAAKIELYRNGRLYRDISDEDNMYLAEKASADEKEVEYELRAVNEFGEARKIIKIIVTQIAAIIKEFKVNTYKIKENKIFTLRWHVISFTTLKLYRNDKFFQLIEGSKNSIELNEESNNENRSQIKYVLFAFNGNIKTESEPLYITIIPAVEKNKYLKPVAIALAVLAIAFFIWLAFTNGLFNNKIVADVPADTIQTIKADTTKSITPDIVSKTAVLPETVNEIWKDASNRLVNVNIPARLIYFSENSQTTYETDTIKQVYEAETPGMYKLMLKEKNTDKIFLIRNVNPQSFELSVCNNADEKNCRAFTTMNLYYPETGTNIFLPVKNILSLDSLQPKQRNKLSRIFRSKADTNYAVSINLINSFIQTPAVSGFLQQLNSYKIHYSITQQSVAIFPANPFQRNYITISANAVSHQPVVNVKEPVVKPQEEVQLNENDSKTRSLGYLVFDDNNQLDGKSMNLLNRIVAHLNTDASSKIIFQSKWTGTDKIQFKKVTNHITAFMQYLQAAGIKSSNTQVSEELVKSANENINRVHILGTGFPQNF